MAVLYGDDIERHIICLLDWFRCVKEVIFGLEDWIDVDFLLEDNTLVGSDCEITSRSDNTQETLVCTEGATSLELLSKTADDPVFVGILRGRFPTYGCFYYSLVWLLAPYAPAYSESRRENRTLGCSRPCS